MVPAVEMRANYFCRETTIENNQKKVQNYKPWYLFHTRSDKTFNPIPAGVLENKVTLGGGSISPPPSKSHVWCPNMINETSLESSSFKIYKKNGICKIQLFIKNVCKKVLSKTGLLTIPFQMCKNFWKILDNLMGN